ncbi:hypothetical protein MRX96_007178 [Rhipicephalus microplus]
MLRPLSITNVDSPLLFVAALVNKGNCCFVNNDLDRAVQYYREALTNEASCVEALYNQDTIASPAPQRVNSSTRSTLIRLLEFVNSSELIKLH